MADDGLDDMEWHTSVGRERDERMPQGVKARLRRLILPTLNADAHGDMGLIKYPSKLLTHAPSCRPIQFANCRKDEAEHLRCGCLDQRLAKRGMNRDGHRPSVRVPFCLLRDNLDNPLLDIHTRPFKAATIPEPESGVDADQKELMPLAPLLFCRVKEPLQLIHRQLPSTVRVFRAEADPFPRIILKSGLIGEDMKDLAKDADAVVVG